MLFSLPIYWEETFKTKPSKVHLAGLNFYRNAHYIQQNKLKKEFEQRLFQQVAGVSFSEGINTFTVKYELFYKNPSSDASNIIALSEKIFLDFAQQANIIKSDTVKHHLGSTWTVAGKDPTLPRVEITVKEIV